MEPHRQKAQVAWLSVASNTVLVALKLVVGLLIGSVSVLSEAIHSGMDLLAAIIALFAVNTAAKPADEDHPFGHGKYENISGTVEALLIFLAAAWIISEAVHKLLHPRPLEMAHWGVLVMLVSALVNQCVSHRLFTVGKATESVALIADAWHLRTDVYTSAGVMGGLAMLWVGRLFGVTIDWIDPISAIAVALLISKAAWDLLHASARDLLDVRLPHDEERWLRRCLSRPRPAVSGFHRLRTRKAGAERFVDLHLLVDPALTVEASHRIADDLTAEIRARFPGAHVQIHIEPGDGRHSEADRSAGGGG